MITHPPRILVVYPSSLYGPDSTGHDEVKSSPLLLASHLARRFPVEYVDLQATVGCPATAPQVRRFTRRVRALLETRRFDILALSCWTSLSYQATLTVARLARQVAPQCLIVVGGYHATGCPEDFLTADGLFDYVVRGEGERTCEQIAEGFPTLGRPSTPRVVVGESSQPRHFAPMNWDLVDGMLRQEHPEGVGTLCVYLSRGCPFACSFCMETLKNRRWRAWPAESAVTELLAPAERHRVRAVAIGDACFGVRPAWRKAVLRELNERRPDHWILLETRPEFLDEEDIALLAGLKVEIQFGIESCSSRMLEIMNKTPRPGQFLDAFRRVSHRLSEHDIVHGVNLIFNHPGETHQTLEETFAFMDAELARGRSSLIWACHGYMHFPGSEIDRNRDRYAREFGARFEKPRWWHDDEDPFRSSRCVVPSGDLDGENRDLWRRMLQARTVRLKEGLTPPAFALAAETYYPQWQQDRRYDPAAV